MNLSKYKKYSELLYNDRFTIHRYIELEDDDGSTIDGLDPNPAFKNIPCRISKVKEDEHNINFDDVNKQSAKLKVFCSPDIEILKGDSLVVERIIDGKVVDTIKAFAGKPMKYSINQEFLLMEEGEA
ncbi:MAG: hypothetical protein E6748_04220 [Clostridium perfringens]|nr:hypothetical protein [Clostridium perfringens]MDZ4991901.1 hypothetical protein [Clostridium perfringens]